MKNTNQVFLNLLCAYFQNQTVVDIPTDLEGLAEKKEEVDYAINLKNKPLRIIKSEELTYQKIR